VTMLFLEEHINVVLPHLQARREDCSAMVGCMSAGEIISLTKLGRFRMGGGDEKSILSLLKRLRGSRKNGQSSGARQISMLKRIPRILRFIPGTAQDVRAYFLTMQYWLAGSDDNIHHLVRCLINRYASGSWSGLRGRLPADAPIEYPEIGVYHPALSERLATDAGALPHKPDAKGTIGLIVMRAYVLSGDTAHYDGVIGALENHGFNVVPVFSSGLDARPAIEQFFLDRQQAATVDAVVSLTGFSLVGGPAYNDTKAAEEILAKLDVPYISAQALEFQSVESWKKSERGLLPIEATMMVAIPELDGSIAPIVYGGRSENALPGSGSELQADEERVEMLARRVARLVRLRKDALAERRIAIVLFNFPPNAGGTGTAAFLSVFQSLFATLEGMRQRGYSVDLPGSVDALRERVLAGNAERFGTDANVHKLVSVDDYVQREPHLGEIEKQWGAAPGRQNVYGNAICICGVQLGNIFIGIQPGFGYEGDPMRLLFEKSFAPTHAFSAFYRYIREDFDANAVLHFGTHGALEFMPGKQAGLTADCWPDRLISDLPNLYLYAANNPSEGTIAKRRSNATLISYMTPPIAQAGLYKGLLELKASMDRYRALLPDQAGEQQKLTVLIQEQAALVDLAEAEPAWGRGAPGIIAKLADQVLEFEYTLIPHGLHVVGTAQTREQRLETLAALADANGGPVPKRALEMITEGAATGEILKSAAQAGVAIDGGQVATLRQADGHLGRDAEVPAIINALEGRYVRPAPGGDLLRTPAVLPTGRNLHGFDPFRLPSAFAMKDGAAQANRLLARHAAEGNAIPESVAIVLWGTDNLKNEGGPIGQALALMGARARFDSYGRLTGAELIPLDELGRARIDVLMTLSGIFRDLLPLQTRMLAEAAYLAATADEPAARNFVRKHALAYQQVNGCDMETAALRVFSNADGAYGSNVNHLIESGSWNDEGELADVYSKRKCFAYGKNGKAAPQGELLKCMLADVELVYQNLESVELGVTTIDHYFDTLGGIGRAVTRERGTQTPVYIGDQTRGYGKVRTLTEQVALETRTRALNPKWYEGMLEHGYEGVRQIEAHVTNTFGWSATTGQVAPWVYQQISQTYVLDEAMRERLAALNPKASVRMANRLLEAQERQYWQPDAETLDALRRAGDQLEDRLEGIVADTAA